MIGIRLSVCLTNMLFGAAVTSAAGTALAQDSIRPEIDSVSKQIRIVVGMPPGGGVDAYARLLQRHLPKFLPSSPSILVQNMPGAGSLRSVLAVPSSWTDTDISIGTFSSSLLTEAVTSPERVKVDFRNFAFLGNVAEYSRVCFVTSMSGVTALADLKSRTPLPFGATAAGPSGNLDTAILQKLFNVPIHLVLGYAGSADKRLALERGEIDGDCAGATSLPADWKESGKIKVLVRFSPGTTPGIDAGVPFGGDLLTDVSQRSIYDFLITPQRFGRLFTASRRITPAALDVLRSAFDAMVADSEFRQDAASLGLLVTPTSGIDVDHHTASMYGTSKDLLARARAIEAERTARMGRANENQGDWK